jgi:hypothetical protein
MKTKIFCSVCEVSFVYRDSLALGDSVICPVCGARLEIIKLEPEVEAVRFPQKPEDEILERIDNYARIKGYVFNENKQEVVDGMLEKNTKYGDFYCPCRFDNIKENVCPCRETRMNQVKKEGRCL